MPKEKSNPKNDIEELGVAIFSLDDETIEELGKVLSTEYSREFYAITLDGEYNLKEIAKQVSEDENPRLPNATHHKDRLLRIGLITGKKKLQRKKGHFLNYYKGKPLILIVPKQYESQVKNSKELKKALKNILKFGAIGGVAFLVHAFFELHTSAVSVMGSASLALVTIPPVVIAVGFLIEFTYGYYMNSRLKIEDSMVIE